MRDEFRLASCGVESGGISYLERLLAASRFTSTENCRLTWIAADGKVLFDTRVPPAEMEGHKNRMEVREALASGEGYGVRYSKTLTELTMYCARRLSDGTVLRISISQQTVFALAMGMLQPIMLTAILAIILSALLARRISKNIVAPLNNLDLDKPLENDVYEELSPLLKRIHQQHLQIEAHLRELREKTEEFEQITESMREGLVLLDGNGVILSINPAARKIFLADGACVGQEFLVIDREHEMGRAIRLAQKGGA